MPASRDAETGERQLASDAASNAATTTTATLLYDSAACAQHGSNASR